MSDLIIETINYIQESPFALLVTVDHELKPSTRYIGPVVNKGLNIYFCSRIDSSKCKHIEQNSSVSLYFQKTHQKKDDFKGITINGEATRVLDEIECEDFLKQLSLISSGYENYIRKDGFKTWTVYKVTGKTLQFTSTDFQKTNRTVTLEI